MLFISKYPNSFFFTLPAANVYAQCVSAFPLLSCLAKNHRVAVSHFIFNSFVLNFRQRIVPLFKFITIKAANLRCRWISILHTRYIRARWARGWKRERILQQPRTHINSLQWRQFNVLIRINIIYYFVYYTHTRANVGYTRVCITSTTLAWELRSLHLKYEFFAFFLDISHRNTACFRRFRHDNHIIVPW